jgi:hypothetical protein
MAEEIKVGDWISYRVSGLKDRGKVVHSDGESYTVLVKGQSHGQLAVIGKDGVEKIAPPRHQE